MATKKKEPKPSKEQVQLDKLRDAALSLIANIERRGLDTQAGQEEIQCIKDCLK